MDKGSKQIELRSEKVRNIIGQVPPILLRYGIMIIGGALLVLVGVSAFIPYQPSFDTKIKIEQNVLGELNYSALIPQEVMKKQLSIKLLSLRVASQTPLPNQYQITSISDTVYISNNKVLHQATLIPIDTISQHIRLDTETSIPAKIVLKKQSILSWLLSSFLRLKISQ